MSTATTTISPTAIVTSTSRIEDYILLIGVALGASAQFLVPNTSVFGMPPLLLGAILGSIGKGLSGLHNYKSYEDWILVIAATLGALAATLGESHHIEYAVYGLVIGQMGKAVLCFIGTNKANLAENVLLFVFAALTAFGQAFNIPLLLNISLFVSAMAKALPSLGLSTAVVTVAVTPPTIPKAAPPPAPTATTPAK